MEEQMLVLSMILVVLLSISQAYWLERYSDLRIDCGAPNQTPATDDDFVSWLTDENFVNAGKNHLLSYSQNFSTMNSLRYFPDDQKNCYFLPFDSLGTKFLFRAGFYYGNYDGLSKPPSFNLGIDGNLWVTVTTNSMPKDEPIYHEMIYWTKGDSAQVCLEQTGDGIPFISSLEATEIILNDMYRLMDNKTALLLHSRINYGANKSIE
ncbi:putative leucine-rich repeat receptor-like serine/threonine-protein kinase At2g04300 [Hevea brasiliensis]|uniref:putative leucine-rich repeat receptor-like serine/threonine-protein kinase At2g04300 n=1 Tax=Hevea brasiliensis TaxID=3981 RepID=UPI0025F5F421|nr:putative leucine-rich repeat receptor-like serine/threonine-protein kinase At2g04300 [Hevea brasiliensis]